MAEELGHTEREIVAQRVRKAEELRRRGVDPFGNGHAPRAPDRRGGGAPGRGPGG